MDFAQAGLRDNEHMQLLSPEGTLPDGAQLTELSLDLYKVFLAYEMNGIKL